LVGNEKGISAVFLCRCRIGRLPYGS